jgi:hypothetical protein
MRHPGTRHGPLQVVRAEDVLNRQLLPEDLDTEDRLLPLQLERRRTAERLLDPLDRDGEIADGFRRGGAVSGSPCDAATAGGEPGAGAAIGT